jgi:hypothetical protein
MPGSNANLGLKVRTAGVWFIVRGWGTGISAGGGIRTLFSYLATGPKRLPPAQTHNRTSRQLTVTVPKMCPECAHATYCDVDAGHLPR